MVRARRLRRTRPRLRDHRHPRPEARDRQRRQDDRPARRDEDARGAAARQDDAARSCGRPRGLRDVAASPGRRSAAGRRARTRASTGSQRSRAGSSTRPSSSLAIADLARRQGRQPDGKPEDHDRGRSQLARRPAPGRVGGPGLHRRRRLPGVPGRQQSFLDDSKTEEMRPEVRHWVGRIGTVGHLCTGSRLRARRRIPDQGCVQYNAKAAVGLDGALAKVQHQTYGHFLLGVVACRPARVRALLDQRRPLPAHLDRRRHHGFRHARPSNDRRPSWPP